MSTPYAIGLSFFLTVALLSFFAVGYLWGRRDERRYQDEAWRRKVLRQ